MPYRGSTTSPTGDARSSVIGSVFEALEGRRLLRASPMREAVELAVDDLRGLLPTASSTVAAAFVRAMDLDQYAPSELAAVDEWVFVADAGDQPATLARELGASAVAPSGVLPGVFVADFSNFQVLGQVFDSFGGAEIIAYYPLVSQQRGVRLIPNDALFAQQWHLRNTGQGGGAVGADANVASAWGSYNGAGVRIGIVDDGLYGTHQDISPNFSLDHSFDWVDNNQNPAGGGHGTAVGGVAGAHGSNGIGVSGAAPLASLAGLRLLGSQQTDAIEAAALSFHRDDIDIYNNSWGPSDDGFTLEGPGPLTLAAMEQTATLGRNGLGSVYVWAGGNGGSSDNANKDGYVNNRHVVSVAAINNFGASSGYSEDGANHLVSAYSDGGSLGITTTSGSGNSYTSGFGGTSSASPLAAGVVALMLDANPNLTARDVQHILVQSAEKVSPNHSSWGVNGAGHDVSHRFGFGGVDATAAVALAQTWRNVGDETSFASGTQTVGVAIPNSNPAGLTRTFEVTDDITLEHVEVILNISHTARGNLEVFLTSPHGTISKLLATGPDTGNHYTNWSVTSTHHWDEHSAGTWTLKVADRSGADVGTWNSWSLNLFGAASEVAPAVTDQAFEFETAHALRIAFSQNVSASLDGSDLTVTNLTAGGTVAAELFSYDALTNTATFIFPGQPGGILATGNYVAQITGTVTNADGTPLAPPPALDFFYQTGDATRDRRVDLADFNVLRANFGASPRTFSQGDLTYDGVVNLDDFNVLRAHFGAFLPPHGENLFGDGDGGEGGSDGV